MNTVELRVYPTRNRGRIILEVRPGLLYLFMYLVNAMGNEISLKQRNCLSEILSSEIRSYFILGVTCSLVRNVSPNGDTMYSKIKSSCAKDRPEKKSTRSRVGNKIKIVCIGNTLINTISERDTLSYIRGTFT